MKENSIKRRVSTRLKHYDYSQNGFYFITICTNQMKCLFGKIIDEKMILNKAGIMIKEYWLKIPEKFQNVTLDEYIIMPNHFHGIIEIRNDTLEPNVGATQGAAQKNEHDSRKTKATTRVAPTLGKIIGAFKSTTTNNYIAKVKSGVFSPFNKTLWQRNYYEHVIRNEEKLTKIRQYINNNPQKWHLDEFFA